MLAAVLFLGSALRRAWWGPGEFPPATTTQNIVILVLSLAGVAGAAAAVRYRKWGILVSLACSGGLVVAYRSVGASWLAVALFAVAILFLAWEARQQWFLMRW